MIINRHFCGDFTLYIHHNILEQKTPGTYKVRIRTDGSARSIKANPSKDLPSCWGAFLLKVCFLSLRLIQGVFKILGKGIANWEKCGIIRELINKCTGKED